MPRNTEATLNRRDYQSLCWLTLRNGWKGQNDAVKALMSPL